MKGGEKLTKEKLQLSLQNTKITQAQTHSNIMRWSGVVAKVDVPSNHQPSSGSESPILLKSSAVQAAISSLKSMPLNCSWPDDWANNSTKPFCKHDTRFVIGHIEDAWIDGEDLLCSGVIYKDNFPDVAYMINSALKSLGFSIEGHIMAKAYNTEHNVLEIDAVEFLGVTVLWSDVAAYTDTYFTHLAASAKTKDIKENDGMNEEQMKALFGEFQKNLTEEFTKVQASIAQVTERVEGLEQKQTEATKIEAAKVEADAITKLEASNAELKAQLEKLQASQIVPPSAVQTAAPKEKTQLNVYSELKGIDKLTCSVAEKQQKKLNLLLKLEA